MNIIPKSTAARVRFACLLCLLVAVCGFYRVDRIAGYYLSDKKEGDILFQSLPRGDLVDAIEGITNSEWSHCGILLKRNGDWVVAEAIGEVRFTPLHLWISRGRSSKVASYRVRNLTAGYEDRLHAGVQGFIGRPYDFRYAPEDDEIYCSELVYKVFDRELSTKIGQWELLGDLNWKPFEAFVRQMENGDLPLDRSMITPVALTRSDLVDKVH